MKYTHVVDAIQVEKFNQKEIRDFCGKTKVTCYQQYENITSNKYMIAYLIVCTIQGVSIATKGDYIVKNDEAGLTVYSKEDFEKLYTPVKEDNNG